MTAAKGQRSAAIETVERDGPLLCFVLKDGTRVTMPLWWYPRLCDATDQELANWRLLGRGEGVHWPDLDEYIWVQHVLKGKSSWESAWSLGLWLLTRQEDRNIDPETMRKHYESLGEGSHD